MTKFIFIITIFFVTTKAVAQSLGFKGSLDSIFVDYTNKYESKIYVVNATRLGGVDLFSIRTEPAYDKQTIDKYFIYKKRLVIYTTTDSIKRSEYINYKYCHNFKDTIYGYSSSFDGNYDPIAPSMFYVAISPQKMMKVEAYDEIPNLDIPKAVDRNGILFSSLNNLLNTFINNNYAYIYEIRFNRYEGKIYVSLATSEYYDRTKIDGYFFRNSHLVTLYFLETVKSLNLFDYNEIISFKGGINNYKSKIRKPIEWIYPYPVRFILKKNKLKPLKNKGKPLFF